MSQESLLFAYAKTYAQISCAVTAQMISAFIFATLDSAISLLSKSDPKFKPLAIFCGCTDWFVSDLVGNPEHRFSRDAAQMNNVVNFSVGQRWRWRGWR